MKIFQINWFTFCKLFDVLIPSPNYIIGDLLERKIWSSCSFGVISVNFNLDELIYVFFEPNPIDANTFTAPFVIMEIFDLYVKTMPKDISNSDVRNAFFWALHSRYFFSIFFMHFKINSSLMGLGGIMLRFSASYTWRYSRRKSKYNDDFPPSKSEK